MRPGLSFSCVLDDVRQSLDACASSLITGMCDACVTTWAAVAIPGRCTPSNGTHAAGGRGGGSESVRV